MNQQQTAVFRCHDADACVMGQKACPTPSICGCEVAERAVKEGGRKPAESIHQIQEPSAAEQAVWHAGLDEGQAQAARTVVVPDDMSSTEANTKYGESYGVDWVYEGKTASPAHPADRPARSNHEYPGEQGKT